MNSRRPEGFVVGQWLAQRPSPVSALLHTAARYADATRKIHHHFDAAWALQLRVVRQRGDTLIIFSDSAAALVMARAHQSQLLHAVTPLLSPPPQRAVFRVVPQVSLR
tara:strand:+ start:2850 stop:3173 length:324 start_codon:yes stop_codon:yes gene_type:complete